MNGDSLSVVKLRKNGISYHTYAKSSTNWLKPSTMWQHYIFSNALTPRLHIKQCHLNNRNVFQPYVKRKHHPDSWKIYFKSSFLASLKQEIFLIYQSPPTCCRQNGNRLFQATVKCYKRYEDVNSVGLPTL